MSDRVARRSDGVEIGFHRLGNEVEEGPRPPRQAAMAQVDGMNIKPRPGDIRQHMFQPARAKIGTHDVIGAKGDPLASHRQITGKTCAVDKIRPRNRDPLKVIALDQWPSPVTAHIGIADADVA